jgi:hypothetical protein
LARQLNRDETESFVEESIQFLLLDLYTDLSAIENKLSPERQVQRASADLVTIETALSHETTPGETRKSDEPHKFFVEGEIIESEQILNWLREIYFQGTGHGEPHGNYHRLVGPVGERPLHVCFLRANEFKSTEDRSIRQGILKGAKKYILDRNMAEVSVPYGKDYCAAMGKLILDGMISMQPIEFKTIQSHPLKRPPHYSFLREWVQQTYRRGPEKDEEVYDSKKLVSTGLYEGETVLYFSITSKDLQIVRWLLANGVKYVKTAFFVTLPSKLM